MSAENFSIFLREFMCSKGRKPGQLAADIGISRTTVNRWLSGKDRPSPKSCRQIAAYTGISLRKILAAADHLPGFNQEEVNLPEFREYARLKYPAEFDEDLINQIDGLIHRRRQESRTEGSSN